MFLGLWQGNYQNQTQLWARWWDGEGNLLLTGEERARIAEQQRDAAEQRARELEQSQVQAIARLLQLGLTPEQVAEALNVDVSRVV
ncbi:hypothetical protein [Spirulina subsalsa]|uniref:hypothetical protein n=1 Tax=Spirulina subsalsa TaxID=54311 RepID=UPI0002D7F5A5|nr:hypothetical protein [Spirulina subsalsa]